MKDLNDLKNKIKLLTKFIGQDEEKISNKFEKIDSIEAARIFDIVLNRVTVNDLVIPLIEMIKTEMRKIRNIKDRIDVGKVSFEEEINQAMERRFKYLKEDFAEALDNIREFVAYIIAEDFYKEGE